MLARIIVQSEGMTNYWFSPDDELDAALILSGYVDHIPLGRYCFQTTYLNDRYREILEHRNGHRIVWVLRNPWSVAYSMLYNWASEPLRELFMSCGAPVLKGIDKLIFGFVGARGIPLIRQAGWSYYGKLLQLLELSASLRRNEMLVVDYDYLVTEPNTVLSKLYDFIALKYDPEYAEPIHSGSLTKMTKFSALQTASVTGICGSIYSAAKELAENKSMRAVDANDPAGPA